VPRLNAGTASLGRPQAAALGERTKAALSAQNALDVRLYDAIVGRFDALVAERLHVQ